MFCRSQTLMHEKIHWKVLSNADSHKGTTKAPAINSTQPGQSTTGERFRTSPRPATWRRLTTAVVKGRTTLGGCWWLLTPIINYQHNLHIYLIPSPNIVIGFDSNKFHEFWCSHLSCRIFKFLKNKIISNGELECTIAKSSSSWSKWIYYLLYLELRIKRYLFRNKSPY